MPMSKVRATSLAVAALFLMSTSQVFAGTITWNFSNGPSPIGNTYAFTPSSGGSTPTLTASGFACGTLASPTQCAAGNTGVADGLFYKNAGAGETGLGLVTNGNTLDNEINQSHFIELNFTNILAAGDTPLTITIGSVQGSSGSCTTSTCEGFVVAQGGTAGSFGTVVNSESGLGSPGGSGNVTETLTVTNANPYIDLSGFPADSSGDHNVLLVEVDATSPVPEPSSLILFGSGLSGLVGMLRRKILS